MNRPSRVSIHVIALLCVFLALCSGELQFKGKNTRSQGVAAAFTATTNGEAEKKKCINGVCGSIDNVLRISGGEVRIPMLPTIKRAISVESAWLKVRGGARSWGNSNSNSNGNSSNNKDIEGGDDAGQDGSDYISKQIAKQDRDSKNKDGKSGGSAADTGDRDGKVETDLGLNGKPKKKHSLFNNIFRLRFVTSLIKKFLQIFISDPDITSIVSRLLSWVIWSYVVLSIMGTCGVDTKPVLSLLSISGLTLGFAAKDILTNTYAGAYIMFMRPFKRGMTITVDSDNYNGIPLRGKVLSIDTNYVQLLCSNGSKILLPSHSVYGRAIWIESAGT